MVRTSWVFAMLLVLISACGHSSDVPGPTRTRAAPLPALHATLSATTAASACCNDPTCDRIVFAKAGGVCPGDPRIRGPLPPQGHIAVATKKK